MKHVWLWAWVIHAEHIRAMWLAVVAVYGGCLLCPLYPLLCKITTKAYYQWKKIQLISLKTSRRWYRQALDCRWLNISSKDCSTKTRNTRSLQDDRHLLCSRATSGFTLPFHNRYFWSVGNFVFHKYESQKTIFILDFTSSKTVSRRICYTWIALLSLNF